jgi:regulator of protease activity HflC (stomatin/prohibitin superfamily)
MVSTDKRGEVVALLGGLTSLLAGVVLIILAVWSESTAVWATAFQALGAVGIWLLALIQLNQHRLLAEERLEVAELERQRQAQLAGAQTIFKEEDLGQMESLAMGRRLRTIERDLVPTLALTVALFHLGAGVIIVPFTWTMPASWRVATIQFATGLVSPEKVTVLLFFMGGISFACFMLSRYALGMSRIPQWNLLRAGGNFMFGTSALCLVVCLMLLCIITGIQGIELWAGWSIGVLLIFLAVETIFNFIAGFYRPRVPGETERPFYDSRLLGMFSEPEGILRSMANAIDYQFGFRVSETWFYKLLGRAVIPLLLVQVAVIAALTCIVVVPPGHQAVIEHLGRRPETTAKPGIHFTWFWPIDRATIIPVERVQRMAVGYEEELKKDEEDIGAPILWTKKHYKKEYQLLVADRTASATSKVPINLLSMNMPVQWRVKDADEEVIRYHSQADDVPAIIESLAFRELTRYAAQADVLDLLGHGGIEASRELHERIQAACDSAGYDGSGLGVKIVHVGIGGVHPPPDEDVAKSYEEVVSAFETRDASIKEALGDAAKRRVESAGTQWKALYDAIVAEDKARAEGAKDLAERTAEVERILLTQAGGEARSFAADARRSAFTSVFRVKSEAESYATQLAAYQAAPSVYLHRQYLKMVEEGLKSVRKYIIALEDSSAVTYEMDLRPPQPIDILKGEKEMTTIERMGDQK